MPPASSRWTRLREAGTFGRGDCATLPREDFHDDASDTRNDDRSWPVPRRLPARLAPSGDGHAGPGSTAGRAVRLGKKILVVGEKHCSTPDYHSHRVDTAAFLSKSYHLAPGSLEPARGHATAIVTEAFCGERPWSGLGAVMIGLDENHALAPWDGVYFELARAPAFRAIGQEPGWSLDFRDDGLLGRDERPAVRDDRDHHVSGDELSGVRVGDAVIGLAPIWKIRPGRERSGRERPGRIVRRHHVLQCITRNTGVA